MEIDGGPGDLHCMKCLKICNYLKDSYCCKKTKNMTLPQKKAESAFLMICLQRNTIELMVTALLANKKIIDSKGNCAFCRNKKQHEEEKWCAGRTKLQLFLHRIDKDELKVEEYLEKYLEIKTRNRMEQLDIVQARIVREMKAVAIAQGKSEEEVEHILAKQGRKARRMQRSEYKHAEEDNKGVRQRLAAKLVAKKSEIIERFCLAQRTVFVKADCPNVYGRTTTHISYLLE